jgi:uncharacterized protein (UPF0332 family)
MSILKNKSEINLLAAEMLHGNSLYPSVIHCSYYSTFQLMKFIWLEKMGKDENELRSLSNKSSDKGSHEVLINEIVMWLATKGANSRDFNNKIGILKKLRRKADYENTQIDIQISSDSIKLCKETIGILRMLK